MWILHAIGQHIAGGIHAGADDSGEHDRIAGIAHTVAFMILLVRIGDIRAVVLVIGEPILVGIHVGLASRNDQNEVVALTRPGIAGTVATLPPKVTAPAGNVALYRVILIASSNW